MPLVVIATHHKERIRVDDDRPVHVLYVEEIETARSRAALLQRSEPVVERAVAGAVELALAREIWHRAAEVHALPIGRGDRAGRVDEEETALRVEDGLVLRPFEPREDAGPLTRRDLRTDALDLDDADEGNEYPCQPSRRANRGSEQADAQHLTALDARDGP